MFFSISVGYVTYLLPMNLHKLPASSNSTIVWKKVIIDKDNLWTKGQHRIIGTIVPLLRAKCPFKGEMDISKVKVQEDRNSLWTKYNYLYMCESGRERRESSLLISAKLICAYIHLYALLDTLLWWKNGQRKSKSH